MSTLSARSYRATNLFISSLDDVIDKVRIVDHRAVGDDGVNIAVLSDRFSLRGALSFDRCEV